jgi:hypothetical protein
MFFFAACRHFCRLSPSLPIAFFVRDFEGVGEGWPVAFPFGFVFAPQLVGAYLYPRVVMRH